MFARPIVAGRTKTRLIPELGAVAAARLYEGFVRDTLTCVRGVPNALPRLWVAGDPSHASLVQLCDARAAQPTLDLGGRLCAALDAELQRHALALAVGSDAPTLPPRYLALAAARLREVDLVLGPAADGGYYALGVRRDAAVRLRTALSSVRWSTRHTLADTLRGAAAAALSVATLPPWYDVDDASGLALLRLQLSLDPQRAPETARALLDLAPQGIHGVA